MDNTTKTVWQEEPPAAVQHEDAVLKTMMHFFADELLPLFGIKGKVASIAPTELVQLEIKKLFQDFNLVMEDGSWKHFEFQSTNEGIEGLKRFRSYEALASYQYHVSVTTYVLFSGSIRHPVTEFTEGVNTYRVIPIIMQEKSADELIGRLEKCVAEDVPLKREDLVMLPLCPLMGGTMPQKDRIRAAFAITREATTINPDEIRKIEAVIYAMADKFLESMDIEEIMEEIKMTRIGQKLVSAGIAEGLAEGIAEGHAEGMLEGEERVNRLTLLLLEDKRYEDIEKASKDREYQRQLFKEFGI